MEIPLPTTTRCKIMRTMIFETFADPELRKQYRRFCLEDTNIPLLMFIALVLISGFATRFSLQNFWTLNYVMIIAFVVGIISIIIGGATGAVRMAVWEPIASYPLLASQVCLRSNLTDLTHLLTHSPIYHRRVGYIVCDNVVIFSNPFTRRNQNSAFWMICSCVCSPRLVPW